MILQQDIVETTSAAGVGDSVAPKPMPLTPAKVLRWLPPNATPAQQDSAIQAHFKPSEIRWSQRPDTLHLPGHGRGRNLLDIQLPQYYREGFFSKDSLFHPELPGGRYGVAGDPIPYSVHSDNVITSLLLVFFVIAALVLSDARHFIIRQAKSFFYVPRDYSLEVVETGNELRFQSFLVFVTSFLISIMYYYYTLTRYGDTFILDSPYYLLAIYLVMVIAYFVLKNVLYTLVNNVFFNSKRNRQWMKSLLFITSVEGLLLFPIVILWAYFDLSMENVVIYFTIVLIIVKILTIYRCFVIFFRQNVVRLQIILYFCTLEIVPLLAFWVALEFTADSLKINY